MLKPAGPKRDMVMYKASSGADIEFTWGLDLKLTETRCANRDGDAPLLRPWKKPFAISRDLYHMVSAICEFETEKKR